MHQSSKSSHQIQSFFLQPPNPTAPITKKNYNDSTLTDEVRAYLRSFEHDSSPSVRNNTIPTKKNIQIPQIGIINRSHLNFMAANFEDPMKKIMKDEFKHFECIFNKEDNYNEKNFSAVKLKKEGGNIKLAEKTIKIKKFMKRKLDGDRNAKGEKGENHMKIVLRKKINGTEMNSF